MKQSNQIQQPSVTDIPVATNDITERAFIRSASMNILSSLILRDGDVKEDLVKKAVNTAISLNDEINRRFKQK